MKRQETVEVEICDLCEKHHAWDKCLGCGKGICYDCEKSGAAIKYSHGINVGGSGDGHYCRDCDKRLAAAGDQLHAAYRVIRNLRDEQEGWYQDFRARSEKAEANLKRLQGNG